MNRKPFPSRNTNSTATTSVAICLFLLCLLGALTTHSNAFIVLAVTVGLLGLTSCIVTKLANQPPTASLDSPPGEQMVSMVALFDELPFVDEAVLTAQVNRAWGVEMENNKDEESFVAGAAPMFVVKTPHQMYVVNYLDSNYFDNVDEVLEQVTEMRVSKVVRSHRGWISVDLVSDSQGLQPDVHFAMIGRLLNQLANQDCVALLLPHQMRLLPWDEAIEAALASGNSPESLRPSQPPVIPIDEQHPGLLAAVEMAKKNFSQFVTAFENHQRDEDRDDSRQFAVKTSITVAGVTEFMWIAATAIENKILYGTLDNHPVSLPGLRRGERVRVPVGKIHDWFYTQNDRHFGGFTTKVITDWACTKQASS